MGEACKELEVVTDEALTADAGTEAEEGIEGRKVVWTWLGFACLVDEEDRVGWEVEDIGGCGCSSEVAFAIKAGLEVPGIALSGNEELPQWRSLAELQVDIEGSRLTKAQGL
jgi:hypothetical protein